MIDMIDWWRSERRRRGGNVLCCFFLTNLIVIQSRFANDHEKEIWHNKVASIASFDKVNQMKLPSENESEEIWSKNRGNRLASLRLRVLMRREKRHDTIFRQLWVGLFILSTPWINNKRLENGIHRHLVYRCMIRHFKIEHEVLKKYIVHISIFFVIASIVDEKDRLDFASNIRSCHIEPSLAVN